MVKNFRGKGGACGFLLQLTLYLVFGELWSFISDYLGSAMLLWADVLDGNAGTLFSKFQI